MLKVRPSEWRPVGIKALEPAAENAVRARSNSLVIAGPGAGKTELLAQRACFLLQTGICTSPLRILAISFKRDAARNLFERVHIRCGPELARRFESLTFDAFAKRTVDHFLRALPPDLRPSPDYQIKFREVTFKPAARIAGAPLPLDTQWAIYLKQHNPSWLNFPMLGRLAAHLLYVNPLILKALRATYAYLFLDEFQDTTDIQYDLTRVAFLGSSTIVTSVGDPKQRIMRWAGALEGVFQSFRTEFGAKVYPLLLNHRSAPELVRIQMYLAKSIEQETASMQAVDDGSAGAGECRILEFDDIYDEAGALANLIQTWINSENLLPRDICVLTRIQPANYTPTLTSNLLKLGIESRVESDLQDLLAEPITTIVMSFLRLGSGKRDPEAWNAAMDLMKNIRGDDQEASEQEIEKGLTNFIHRLRKKMKTSGTSEGETRGLVEGILSYIGEPELTLLYPQYAQGDFYRDQIKQILSYLSEYRKDDNWPRTLDKFEGKNSVPIMTIHKSKGLEYHTVVFVGLEDSAFWGFQKSPKEESCNFFVAFSRAKKRVIFTFCRQRPRRPWGFRGKAGANPKLIRSGFRN